MSAALALAGCATAPAIPSTAVSTSSTVTAGASTGPVASVVPWVDATPTPAPSPTATVIPPGTAACAATALTATAGWQGATGQMVGWLAVTNVGREPCVVSGSPRLVQLESGSTILAPIDYTAGRDAGPGSDTGIAGRVLLRPGDQAGAFLLWSNWCARMIPMVTALRVTLPDGSGPVTATAASPGPGLGSVPRCDQPTAGSTFTAFAFVPVPPQAPAYEPQAASVALSVPPTAAAGVDLAFEVTLSNRGTGDASLSPCPTYTEDLIVDGRALKPPAPEQRLLNCADIGPSLAPGASVTMEIRYSVPAGVGPGPVELVWGMDPGGPFDAGTAIGRAPLAITGP